ncbi:MAG: hypothetical protein HN921_09530 [Bacteroidetes bacterium]|nr:hypothetical protein [Bacteroidota bacterium]MBT4729319.1 hypothetical protein [Bacteroidota bacterium]MBT7040073.1 hypothetical protein [Bacteroidota bacterium]
MSFVFSTKRIGFFLIIFSLIFTQYSCNINNNLDAEGYLFYYIDEYGYQVKQSDAVFQKSQTIIVYLLNVGPFEADSDSLVKLNMDVEILYGKKKSVFEKENYLGDEDFTESKDTIPFLYAVWQASELNETGQYTFKLRVKDEVSGHKSIFKPTFTIVD